METQNKRDNLNSLQQRDWINYTTHEEFQAAADKEHRLNQMKVHPVDVVTGFLALSGLVAIAYLCFFFAAC